MNYVDPDGRVHGCVIGAIIGGAISGTTAIINDKSFTEVIAATVGGAVDGAIGSFGKSFGYKLLANTAGGGVGSLVEQVLNKAFGNEDEINITEITVDSGFGAITGSIDGCGEALKNTIKSTQYQKNLTEQILSSSNTKITTKKAKSEVKEIITVEDKLVDKTTKGITNTLDLYYNLESE